MNQNLLRKLLINALNDLNDRYGCDGCNDLMVGDPLFKNVTDKEKLEITKRFTSFFPKQSEELDFELLFNGQIVDVLIKELQNNE